MYKYTHMQQHTLRTQAHMLTTHIYDIKDVCCAIERQFLNYILIKKSHVFEWFWKSITECSFQKVIIFSSIMDWLSFLLITFEYTIHFISTHWNDSDFTWSMISLNTRIITRVLSFIKQRHISIWHLANCPFLISKTGHWRGLLLRVDWQLCWDRSVGTSLLTSSSCFNYRPENFRREESVGKSFFEKCIFLPSELIFPSNILEKCAGGRLSQGNMRQCSTQSKLSSYLEYRFVKMSCVQESH